MSKKNQKQIDMSIVLIFTVLIVVVLIIIAISNMIRGGKDVEYKGKLGSEVSVDSGRDANIVINEREAEEKLLEKMTERARIEHYVTDFIAYVEDENYDEAYKLLNDAFKKNYFSSKTKFEEYMKKNFSKMMDIEYTNFERSGDVYVLWVTVTDTINGDKDSGKEMNFVVKENAYNDFELSFSAE